MAFLIASGIFAIVFVLLLLFFTGRGKEADQNRELLRRLARPDEEADLSITRSRKQESAGWLFALFYRMNLLRKLEREMWQAGIYTRVSDVLIIMILLFGGGAAAGQAFWGGGWLALASGAALTIIPVVYIRVRRRRRLKAFSQQLPFALDLVKSSLEAGHSFQRALQVMVGEFREPLGSEFRTVLEQNRIGLPLPRALEEMLKRVPIDDLRLLTVAVKVQNEVGTSLAQIVGRLSEIVRIRQRLRLQIRALTAQSRFGGIVVGVLPVIVLVAFSFIQPSYTHELFYDPTGQKILKLAIGLDLAAIITVRRLLRIEY